MSETFATLYAPTLKAVFTKQAQQHIAQGAEAFGSARAYAELGKPDFTLAFLLLAQESDEEKREMLAHAYERRAALAEEKASAYSLQFHRSFPLMKLEARNDLQTARAIRMGKRLEERE